MGWFYRSVSRHQRRWPFGYGSGLKILARKNQKIFGFFCTRSVGSGLRTLNSCFLQICFRRKGKWKLFSSWCSLLLGSGGNSFGILLHEFALCQKSSILAGTYCGCSTTYLSFWAPCSKLEFSANSVTQSFKFSKFDSYCRTRFFTDLYIDCRSRFTGSSIICHFWIHQFACFPNCRH